jgi:hypothetical protein
MRQSLKKILKIFLYLMSLFVFLTGTFFLYFLVKKDDIAAGLLLGLNENINGEVRFSDIYLDPFAQFPYISLALENFSLYEHEEGDRTILEDPVTEFENVFVAVDFFDLFADRFVVTKVLFSDGYLDIVRYQNRHHNFEIALEKKKSQNEKKIVVKKKKVTKADSTKTKKKRKKKKSFISKNLRLNLNRVSLKNVHLEYNNQLNGSQHNFFIYSMVSSLSIMPDTIKTNLYLKSEIKNLELFKNASFDGLVTQLNSRFSIARNDSILWIEPSKLVFSRAEFRVKGMLDLKEQGRIDLKLRGADRQLGFLNLLLSKSGLENLKTGSLYLHGSLKGNFSDEIPELNIKFGIRDLSVKIPEENDSIKNLKLFGSFVSGNKKDLSEATLKIDTLKAKLPGGYLDAVFRLKKISSPDIDFKISLLAKVQGFDKLFRQNFIDSLKGYVELESEFKGSWGPDSKSIRVDKSQLHLKLDSISLGMSNYLILNSLSGILSGDYNKLKLDNIKFNIAESDLKINGNLVNLSNLVVDKGKKIRAKLTIQSNLIRSKDFFTSKNQNNFNPNIQNLDIRIRASAKKSDLFEFEHVPKITIDIVKLNGRIDSVTKPLNFEKGHLMLADYKEGFQLNLDKFSIKALKGKLLGSVGYLWERKGRARLFIKAEMKQLRLIDILDNSLIDSSMSLYSSGLSSQVDCKFGIRDDKFRQFRLLFDKVNYTEKKNKTQLNKVELKSKGFYFNNNKWDDLIGKFSLKVGKIRSKHYNFKDVVYSIDAQNKKITIVPENDSILGVKAEGKLIISPYENPPTYSLDYSLKQFPVGEMFVNFLEDSILSGKADFYMNLSFKGNDEKSILQTLDGKIRLRAKNLILYGANMDKFIDSYRKSSTLNLLDIGVVIYAGPIGLLATKGGGFARVKVTDRKKKSSIDRMISDWKIVGDSIIVDDVAIRTKQNRLALKGWYCYSSDSLDFKIGLLDPKGCSELTQEFLGSSTKPEMNNPGLFSTLQSKNKSEKECKVFYKGKLEHVKKNKIEP